MATPPYHLRTNKGASRQIFIASLREIETCLKIDLNSYTYFGLGGPYLEDFRMMHREWPKMSQISYECEKHIYKRQLFHKFAKPVKLRSGYFDAKILSCDTKSIVWLDFTKFDRTELDLYSGVLQKLGEFSILKITVPINCKNLCKLPAVVPTDASKLQSEISKIQNFKNEFGEANLPFITRDDFVGANVDMVVFKILQIVAQKNVDNTGYLKFCPFYASSYAEPTGMLNLAGIVLKKKDESIKKLVARFKDWKLGCYSWNKKVLDIKLPDLSSKERMRLEEFLPQDIPSGSKLKSILGYNLEDDLEINKKLFDNYAKFSRYSPLFMKIQS